MMPKEIVGALPYFDAENLTLLIDALDVLKTELDAHNNAVKAALDTLKTTQFPDFTASAETPALMCSVVQTDAFVAYAQKITEFKAGVIDQILASLESNIY